jgi:hypothetical protein
LKDLFSSHLCGEMSAGEDKIVRGGKKRKFWSRTQGARGGGEEWNIDSSWRLLKELARDVWNIKKRGAHTRSPRHSALWHCRLARYCSMLCSAAKRLIKSLRAKIAGGWAPERTAEMKNETQPAQIWPTAHTHTYSSPDTLFERLALFVPLGRALLRRHTFRQKKELSAKILWICRHSKIFHPLANASLSKHKVRGGGELLLHSLSIYANKRPGWEKIGGHTGVCFSKKRKRSANFW